MTIMHEVQMVIVQIIPMIDMPDLCVPAIVAMNVSVIAMNFSIVTGRRNCAGPRHGQNGSENNSPTHLTLLHGIRLIATRRLQKSP